MKYISSAHRAPTKRNSKMQNFLIKDTNNGSNNMSTPKAAKEAKRRLGVHASQIIMITDKNNALNNFWMKAVDVDYFTALLKKEGFELGQSFTAEHIINVNKKPKKPKKAKAPALAPTSKRVVMARVGEGTVIGIEGNASIVLFDNGETKKVVSIFLKEAN